MLSNTASMRPASKSRVCCSDDLYVLTVTVSLKVSSMNCCWLVESGTPMVLPLRDAWISLNTGSHAALSFVDMASPVLGNLARGDVLRTPNVLDVRAYGTVKSMTSRRFGFGPIVNTASNLPAIRLGTWLSQS